jgi:hypothetical protein
LLAVSGARPTVSRLFWEQEKRGSTPRCPTLSDGEVAQWVERRERSIAEVAGSNPAFATGQHTIGSHVTGVRSCSAGSLGGVRHPCDPRGGVSGDGAHPSHRKVIDGGAGEL